MEILKFLLSFFLKEYGISDFMPIFNELQKNSFDIRKTISNINPEIVKPIISMLLSKKTTPPQSSEVVNKLNPIYSFTDKKIIDSLNNYFS